MNCLKDNLSIQFLTYLFYVINICKLLCTTYHSSFIAKLWPTLCDPMVCSMPGFLSFPISWSLVKLMSIELVGDAIQPSHSSVAPFSFSQSFLASGSFPMSWLFQSDSHKYWSFSFSICPSNEYSRLIFLGSTGLICLLSKGLWRVFSSTTVSKYQFFSSQPSLWSNFHIHTWLLEKPKLWLYGLLLAKWCLYFLIHCLDCHNFIPKSKHLLLSWLQSPSVVILEPKKIKSVTVSLFPYLFAMKWWDQMLWA